jgi:dihydrofolate reductase
MELSVNVFISLDGVMQGPGGREEDTTGGFDGGGWIVEFSDEDFGRIVAEKWFAAGDRILLGRTTFDMMRPYWTAITDPANPIATALNTFPKYVVSTTLVEPEWGDTTVISGDVVESIRELKAQPGRELQVHGSWQLVQTLREAGLVDLYRIIVFPVVVGTGKRLFPEGTPLTAFDVVDKEFTSTGAAAFVLRPRQAHPGTFVVEDGRESVA